MQITDLQYFPKIYKIIALVKARSVMITGDWGYQKSPYLNKMELPGSNGTVKLSIPIKGGRSVKLPYKDVEIDRKTDWQTNHLRTISSIYGNAPFYPFYENVIRNLYSSKATNLFQWNLHCFDFFLRNAKMSNMIQYLVGTDDIHPVPTENIAHTLENHPFPIYHQVFADRTGFISNMSCLDLLMNLGPDTASYMNDCLNKLP